jgi:hypothetical protein
MSGWADRIESAGSFLWSSCVPANWPRATRRAFVLTLPVSIPLWLTWCALVFVLTVACGLTAVAGVMIFSAVCGVVVLPAIWTIDAIGKLWSRT